MHPLIEEHKEAIRALCREFGVKRPELFDPGATDAFDPASPRTVTTSARELVDTSSSRTVSKHALGNRWTRS